MDLTSPPSVCTHGMYGPLCCLGIDRQGSQDVDEMSGGSAEKRSCK